MQALSKGRYTVRMACCDADIAAAQILRGQCFRGPDGPADCDPFDAVCDHLLIEETQTGRLVACYRVMALSDGKQVDQSYSAQFYDLSGLANYAGALLEVGRFCMTPDCHDPDVLRLAWGALARLVDSADTRMLFGCTSFHGTDWHPYEQAFAALAQSYLAPAAWCPGVRSPQVFRFAQELRGQSVDQVQAFTQMPALLRSYLSMGGRVSDHAVIDPDLGTVHVFTGLEVSAIPPARARVLRMVAQ